jgi:hypothetical protein
MPRDFLYFDRGSKCFLENKQIESEECIVVEYTFPMNRYHYVLIDFETSIITSKTNDILIEGKLSDIDIKRLKKLVNSLSFMNNIYDYCSIHMTGGAFYKVRYYKEGLKNQFGIYRLLLYEKEPEMKAERLQNIKVIEYMLKLSEKNYDTFSMDDIESNIESDFGYKKFQIKPL